MGAEIEIENMCFNGCEDVCDVVARSGNLKGITIGKSQIPSVIDELPILMVAAARASGQTEIKGAGELRVKETDRIRSMTTALKSMGADISVEGDDIFIRGREELTGAAIDSYGDHRTAMSLVIASLSAGGESKIKDTECINTSFPDFFQLLDSVSVRK